MRGGGGRCEGGGQAAGTGALGRPRATEVRVPGAGLMVEPEERRGEGRGSEHRDWPPIHGLTAVSPLRVCSWTTATASPSPSAPCRSHCALAVPLTCLRRAGRTQTRLPGGFGAPCSAHHPTGCRAGRVTDRDLEALPVSVSSPRLEPGCLWTTPTVLLVSSGVPPLPLPISALSAGCIFHSPIK